MLKAAAGVAEARGVTKRKARRTLPEGWLFVTSTIQDFHNWARTARTHGHTAHTAHTARTAATHTNQHTSLVCADATSVQFLFRVVTASKSLKCRSVYRKRNERQTHTA